MKSEYRAANIYKKWFKKNKVESFKIKIFTGNE